MDSTKNIQISLNIIISLILLLVVYSSLFSQSKTLPVFINLGANVNTSADEYLPYIYNDTLYFRRTIIGENGKISSFVFMTEIKNWKCNNEIIPFKRIDYRYYRESSSKMDRSQILDFSTPRFRNFSDSIQRWAAPKAMGFNFNTNSNDFHPSISSSGDTIVFASNRPNLTDNSDLYISIRRPNGTWTNPSRLGQGINTPENEVSPYIAPDGSLYYASKGFRKGAAEIFWSGEDAKKSNLKSDIHVIETELNYDIIRAVNTGGGWGNPEKLPHPINTEWDEVGPTLYKGKIFLASNRPSNPVWGENPYQYPNFDIYGYCIDECCDEECKDIVLTGEILASCITNRKNAEIEIFNLDSNKSIIKRLLNFDKKFKFVLSGPSNFKETNNWRVRISHPCFRNGYYDTVFTTNCNIESKTSINMVLDLEQECIPCDCERYLTGKILCKNSLRSIDGDIVIFSTDGTEITSTRAIQGEYKTDKFNCQKEYIVRFFNKCIVPDGFVDSRVKDADFRLGSTLNSIIANVNLPEICCTDCKDIAIKGFVKCYNNYYNQGNISITDATGRTIGRTAVNRFGEYSVFVPNYPANYPYKVNFNSRDCKPVQSEDIYPDCEENYELSYNANILIKDNCCIGPPCENKIIQGNISCNSDMVLGSGYVEIYKNFEYHNPELIATVKVDESGYYSKEIPYWAEYLVRYYNVCLEERFLEKIILANCITDNIEKISSSFKILDSELCCPDPCKKKEFSTKKYKVPFFTTGYYYPNTRDNLNTLKRKFDIGGIFNPNSNNSINVRYIENPKDKYDGNISQIESAFQEAVDFIVMSLDSLVIHCKTCSAIKISVIGYTDERNIYPVNAKYIEEAIELNGKTIMPNTAMDNKLLSELRAYHSAEHLKKRLEESNSYLKYLDYIYWDIVGGGVLKSNDDVYDLMRRVNIEIECLKDGKPPTAKGNFNILEPLRSQVSK